MRRFRTLLVPTDFSSHAAAALELAIELAKEHGGELHLLHAYALMPAATMGYDVAIPPSVWEGVREAAARRLEQESARAAEAGVKVTSHLANAPAADAIASAAEELAVDLIVMGTRGFTGLKHVLLGSVAERTIRTAPCPVLTLKSESERRAART